MQSSTSPVNSSEVSLRRRVPWWQPVVRRYSFAILIGFLVTVVVAAVGASRSPQYEARVALIANPVKAADTSSADFSSVVGLNLAGVSELAHSDSLLKSVHRQVPGSSVPDDMLGQIVVDAVPASSVVRITVTQPNPQVAVKVAKAVSANVVDADLLAPNGTFRVLDEDPSAQQVSPDLKLAVGMALLAGLLSGVLSALWLRSRRQRIESVSHLRQLLVGTGLPVLDFHGSNTLGGVMKAVGPVHPVTVGRGVDGLVSDLHPDVSVAPASSAAADRYPVLLLVEVGKTSPTELRSALKLLSRVGLPVVGVSLQ